MSAVLPIATHAEEQMRHIQVIRDTLDKLRPHAHMLADSWYTARVVDEEDHYCTVVDAEGDRPELIYRSDGRLYLLRGDRAEGRKDATFQAVPLAAILADYPPREVRVGLLAVVDLLDHIWNYHSEAWRQDILRRLPTDG